MQIYEFDRLLRRSLFSALEEIEISMRARLAYFHAHKYSPVGYLDASIFSRSHKHQKFLDMFNREVEHSSNVPFVKHHQDCYNGVFPIWVAVEFCIRIPKSGTKNSFRQLKNCLKSIRLQFCWNISRSLKIGRRKRLPRYS